MGREKLLPLRSGRSFSRFASDHWGEEGIRWTRGRAPRAPGQAMGVAAEEGSPDMTDTIDTALAAKAEELGLPRTHRPCVFSLARDGNVGFLEVARKGYSTRDEVSISPKLAVISSRLSGVFGSVPLDAPPEPMLHHWYRSSEAIHDSSRREDLRATECWDYLGTRDPAAWSAALDDLEFRLHAALWRSGSCRRWGGDAGRFSGCLSIAEIANATSCGPGDCGPSYRWSW
jgi:hypothetical protein